MSTSTKELRKMHEKLTDFYPRAYLNNWAAGVREEWAEFLHRVFTAVVPQVENTTSWIEPDKLD